MEFDAKSGKVIDGRDRSAQYVGEPDAKSGKRRVSRRLLRALGVGVVAAAGQALGVSRVVTDAVVGAIAGDDGDRDRDRSGGAPVASTSESGD